MSYDCLTIDTDSYHDFVHKGECTFHYRVMSDGEGVESTWEYCFSHDAKSSSITRFKGLGEISPDEFKHFIGKDMRLEQVTLRKTDSVLVH